MKVGDLVKYRNAHPTEPLGLVLEAGPLRHLRVKWFEPPSAHRVRPCWVSQKNLEVVNESR